MTLEVPVQSWEYPLLALAREPLESAAHLPQFQADGRLLQAAYSHCEALTHFHSKTFYVASGLLPPAKRSAARALYAFCRITDNLVDEAAGDRLAALASWSQTVKMHQPPAAEPVALAWADAQAHFHIPPGYAEQLINGVARDITQTRYQTFADLAEYAYGVASTVGLMTMHIVGYTSYDAVGYAVKLGVALQMTNILRDVGEDWRAGRVYLPQEELAAFGLSDADIARGEVDDRWRAFMRFQIERNRQLYDEARPGISLLKTDGRFAIAAAADLYQAILEDIERHDYDVFNRRASISALGKLRRLPGIWWRARRGPTAA